MFSFLFRKYILKAPNVEAWYRSDREFRAETRLNYPGLWFRVIFAISYLFGDIELICFYYSSNIFRKVHPTRSRILASLFLHILSILYRLLLFLHSTGKTDLHKEFNETWVPSLFDVYDDVYCYHILNNQKIPKWFKPNPDPLYALTQEKLDQRLKIKAYSLNPDTEEAKAYRAERKKSWEKLDAEIKKLLAGFN